MESDEQALEDSGRVFITVVDEKKSSQGKQVLRVNLKNEEEAQAWLEEYREETFTGWIVLKVKKEENCQR